MALNRYYCGMGTYQHSLQLTNCLMLHRLAVNFSNFVANMQRCLSVNHTAMHNSGYNASPIFCHLQCDALHFRIKKVKLWFEICQFSIEFEHYTCVLLPRIIRNNKTQKNTNLMKTQSNYNHTVVFCVRSISRLPLVHRYFFGIELIERGWHAEVHHFPRYHYPRHLCNWVLVVVWHEALPLHTPLWQRHRVCAAAPGVFLFLLLGKEQDDIQNDININNFIAGYFNGFALQSNWISNNWFISLVTFNQSENILAFHLIDIR